MNIAACEEVERQAKFTQKKQVSSKISSFETDSSEFSHKSKKKRKQENDLAATVQYILQASVATLTRAVNDLKANQKNDKTESPTSTNNVPKTGPMSNKKVCPACQDTGSTSCNHCFICSSDNHFAVGCKMAPKRNNPGNRRCPHPWGNLMRPKSQSKSHQYCFCKRFADVDVKFERCSGCHATKYCSNSYQKKHWLEHKSLYKSIQELIARNQASSVPSSSENGQYVTHLTPRQHTTVAKLVGKRCIINCKLNKLEIEALWDTGAQVSVLPEPWVAEQFPGIKLGNIEELEGQGAEIELKAANGNDIPYSLWIELEFKLMSGVDVKNNCAITVPFLSAHQKRLIVLYWALMSLKKF